MGPNNFIFNFLLIFCLLVTNSTQASVKIEELLSDSGIVYMPESQTLNNQLLGFEGYGNLVLKAELPGDPLNLEEKRSSRFLTKEEIIRFNITPTRLQKVFGSSNLNDYYIFAHYVHGLKADRKSRYWIAIVPKNVKIENIMLHIEWFVEGAGAHFQYRMILDRPIVLLPENKVPNTDWHLKLVDSTKMNSHKSLTQTEPMLAKGDFVYTLLATRTMNGSQSWDPIKGITGAYANAYSFQSTEHIAEDQTNRNFVEQIELIIPNQEFAIGILHHTLNFADNRKENDIYNTIFNSCVTAALAGLYANGAGYSIDPSAFNPYRIKKMFKSKGFIKDTKVLSLNSEFNGKIKESDINIEVKGKIDSLLPIIDTDEFDLVARDIVSYAAKYEWKHEEIVELFKLLKALPKTTNLKTLEDAMTESLSKSNLSTVRIDQLKILAKDIFKFVYKNLGKYDPELVQNLIGLTRQN